MRSIPSCMSMSPWPAPESPISTPTAGKSSPGGWCPSLGGLAEVEVCYLGNADNDPYKTLKVDLTSPSYSVGSLNVSNPDNQYELHFTVTELAPPPQPRHVDLPAGGGVYDVFEDGTD